MVKKDQDKILETSFFIALWLILTILFVGMFFLVKPYIHESGHIIFGIGDGLLKGQINALEISNWVSHPWLSFISTPQQIKPLGNSNSLNLILGGPIFSIQVFFGLSFFGYKRSKDWKWFLIFISIVIYEISGNVICGTDNFLGNKLQICNPLLNMVLLSLSLILFSFTWAWFSTKALFRLMKKESKSVKTS